MAARLRTPLLPATLGHSIHGTSQPRIPEEAIEAFLPRVQAAFRATRDTGNEHGFLAYAPQGTDGPLYLEKTCAGHPEGIQWEWDHREATVAFSFHTHPSDHALCAPSGIDAVGAIVRGDHVVYILTMDGRLSGWRFKPDAAHALAVGEALDALEDAQRLRRAFVRFLYDAFEALRPTVMEPVYAARITSRGLVREDVAGGFFTAGESP